MFPFARSLMAVAAIAFASLAGGALRADVLTLANGDTLKGKLVRNTGGMITFRSDILGEIVVSAANASVQIDTPPKTGAASAAGASAAGAAPTAPATGAAQAASTAPSASAAPAGGATGHVAETGAKPRHKRKVRLTPFTTFDPREAASDPGKATKVDDTGWFNRVDLGFASQSGRSKSLNIDLRTENDMRTTLTDTRFQNRYLYGKTSGVTSTDSFLSNLRFRRVLTGRLFLQSNTSYARDVIALTRCDAGQGFGLGMNLKSTKTFVLAAGSDAAVKYRSFFAPDANTPAAPHNLSCVLDVFQDMTLKFNQRFMITQNFLAMVAPTNSEDYKFNFNAGITSKLTDTFNITARVELEYDRTLLPDLRYSQRITTSVGYVF